MQCFKSSETLFYDYENPNNIYAVMVAEDLKLAMTAGVGSKTVLHCLELGRTLRVFEMGTRSIRCLYKLGGVVAVGGKQEVSFFDLIEQRVMNQCPIKTECVITCMKMGVRKSPKTINKENIILFVGGVDSTQLANIILPKAITDKPICLYNFCLKI
jgi:hypothetical protein